MSKIRIVVGIPTRGGFARSKHLVTAAKAAEEMGFDGVSTGDHLHESVDKGNYYNYGQDRSPDFTPDPNVWEPMSTISYLAGICPNLKFYTAVVFLPGRNPVVFAKQTATMDALTGGRFTMGVGVGNATDAEEFKNLGLTLKERWHYGEEYIEAMREIWTKPLASYHGRFVNFDQVSIYPKPVTKPHVPLWFGGKSQHGQRMVARYCTGWIPQFMSPEMHSEGLANIKRLAREYGRSDVDFAVAAQGNVSIDKSEGRAIARLNALLPDAEMLKWSSGFMREIGDSVREELVKRALVGTPSQIAERLDAYARHGVTHFEIHMRYRNMEDLIEEMQLVSKEIIPSFR